ncbi:hypothetical protein EBS67_10595, partial [bacterium]|nr:hypothetical protein [bacterium]
IGWATRGTGGELAWPPAPGTCARVGWAKKHIPNKVLRISLLAILVFMTSPEFWLNYCLYTKVN